jgi:putative ABC transport system permease protein
LTNSSIRSFAFISKNFYWCANAGPSPFYLVRTHGEPSAMAQTLRRKIHEIEPSRSVFDMVPLEQHLYDAFGENRLRAILLTLFSLTAVSLAGVGLYGTLSYFVNVRRREVGLRLALGAMRGEIVRRFLLQGLRVSFLGCIAGLCLALASTRLLAGMLYGVGASNVETFRGVALFVLIIAAAASFAPSLRAARVEPMQVLRDE